MKNTRPVGPSSVGARSSALLDLRTLRTAATRQDRLVLAVALEHWAGLLDAGYRRVCTGASRALVQVELGARVVESGAEHTRAFRR